MNQRLKLGRFFGIDLYVHWTFALLLGFIVFQTRDEGVASILFSVGVVLGVFLCVTLHEYGHALTARRFGIPTIDITLLPIGGVARLKQMPRIPWQELVVAVAGPAVNVVIALMLAIGFVVAYGAGVFNLVFETSEAAAGDSMLFGPPSVAQYAFVLMIVNVTLVIFNMIPAFPMDGGRVFRSVMAMMMNYRTATVIASRVGLVCAAGMAAVAIFGDSLNPIPVLIAVFIGFAGLAEARQVDVMESVRGLTVGQVMVRCQTSFAMDLPITEVIHRWHSIRASSIPVISPVGTVIGMIELEEVGKALAQGIDPALTSAAELINFERSPEPVREHQSLESVITRVGQGSSPLPVVDAAGRLVGVLDFRSMMQRRRLGPQRPQVESETGQFEAFS